MSDLDAAARCASSGASALQREENGSNAQNENTEYEHDRDDWTLSWELIRAAERWRDLRVTEFEFRTPPTDHHPPRLKRAGRQ
jgi:hypothetical protein